MTMMLRGIAVCVLLWYAAGTATADDIEPDSAAIAVDTLRSDSIMPEVSGPDTALTDPNEALADFERRWAERQKELEYTERVEPISLHDTLVHRFTSPRLNQRSQLDRAFFYDAGDYFRYNSAYFVLPYQNTPMRKVVMPYGLAGDRMGVVVDGMSVHPFEHPIEPDGLINMEDLPTALDDDVYIIPGAAGMVLGGDRGLAALVTEPREPDSLHYESAFLLDKGSFGYSFARGRLSKNFASGKEVDLSVGYRTADGLAFSRFDDAYQYFANFYFPIEQTWAVSGAGRIYNRQGPLQLRPDIGGGRVNRDRFDRQFEASAMRMNVDGTAVSRFGYRHLRQGSYLTNPYNARFNYTGHGLYVQRDRSAAGALLRLEAGANHLEYDDGFDSFQEASQEAAITYAVPWAGGNLGLHARQRWVERFGLLGAAAAVWKKETERVLFMSSVGFFMRPPSLHELYLRRQNDIIYSPSTVDYGDVGNPDLTTEKDLVGSLLFEYGSLASALRVEVTGGRILDGIDWHGDVDPATGGTLRLFQPFNGDVSFATVSVRQTVAWTSYIHGIGGAGYHYVDYAYTDTPPYRPEYEAFAGAELYLPWRRKLIDLYGYGEIVYTGPYDGYVETGLGDEVVFNAKFSFRMGKFHFHYIWQNVLSNPYEPREYFEVPGRYNSFGFVWEFLD